ncbi:hypothetical protein [Mangrovicella endophytica]|uniref:hypothetical protein n=1 Tax=Mangrovicella endophytica TaxID=2066697 RepID=UPI000C9DDA70|nr:hypothetical protein [Mangrovicella endophytica]
MNLFDQQLTDQGFSMPERSLIAPAGNQHAKVAHMRALKAEGGKPSALPWILFIDELDRALFG